MKITHEESKKSCGKLCDAAVQAVAGRHYFTPAQMLSDYLDTLIVFGRIAKQDGRLVIKENDK